jgi:uncharacterized ubiquitin-like protein YukD
MKKRIHLWIKETKFKEIEDWRKGKNISKSEAVRDLLDIALNTTDISLTYSHKVIIRTMAIMCQHLKIDQELSNNLMLLLKDIN